MSDDKMEGLGDAVAKVTKALGVKECGGCKKRREALNKAVPFQRNDAQSQKKSEAPRVERDTNSGGNRLQEEAREQLAKAKAKPLGKDV